MENYTNNNQDSIGQVTQKDLVNKDFFNMSFISQKTDKIATAVYMVTEILEETEPLKQALRDKSLRSMSLTKALSLHKKNLSSEDLGRVISNFEEMLSLLSLAGVVGILSEMNTTILVLEISKIIEQLKGKVPEDQSSSRAPVLLSEDFFLIKEEVKPREELSFKMSFTEPQSSTKNGVSFNEKKLKINNVINDINSKNIRQEKIIKIIQNKGSVTIKDIMGHINDCSEKTIQRELGYLVENNVLKKTGERRWSQYALT